MDISELGKKRCWAKDGIWGSSTCSKLNEAIHCRNCKAFENAALEHLDESKVQCDEFVAVEKKENQTQTRSLFLFKCSDHIFALEPTCVGEITSFSSVHRIPHRTGNAMEGISNINGDLVLVLNIYATLNIGRAEANKASLMILCKTSGEKFAFKTDEVFGVRKICECDIKKSENVDSKFVSGVFSYKEYENVLILDAQLLASAIMRRLI